MKDTKNNKSKLLDAAKSLFEEVGYHQTNSNLIAQAAGLASGTFYNHFASKKAIFLEIYKDWHLQQRSQIQELALEGYKGEEFVEKIVETILPFYIDYRGFRSSIHAITASNDDIQNFRLEQRKAIMELVAKVLRLQGIERNFEELAVFQIGFERYFDAYAMGEFDELGISKAAQNNILKHYILNLLK
jgi:AcrR family transcriptional regulator